MGTHEHSAGAMKDLTDSDVRAVLEEIDPDWGDHGFPDPQFALYWYAADDASRRDIREAIKRLGI